MQERQSVLDHGYLLFIEHWGSDERIIEAARMSTNKGFIGWGPKSCEECAGSGRRTIDRPAGWLGEGVGEAGSEVVPCLKCQAQGVVPGDEKLLRYLYEHKHATPFEMAGLVIEVQAPIMVFREWHRHRTQSYNEMSARYTPLPDVNYIATVERLMLNSKTNKQAGVVAGAAELTEERAVAFQEALRSVYRLDEEIYQTALQAGVPKELARLHLPVGRYSRMRASANLRNWLAFLTLRMDKAAQWEIRQYANGVGALIAALYPRTWALFVEGKQ